MVTTTTHWKKEHQFESEHLGNKIQIDGDNKEGHGPKALLLSGLAGCSGIDVVDILGKMRVPFSNFSMQVNAELTDEQPKVYAEIKIIYMLDAAIDNKEKIEKAIDLSLEKYCGVAAMLSKTASISYSLIITPLP